MQIKPSGAQGCGKTFIGGSPIFNGSTRPVGKYKLDDPDDNIELGVALLCNCYGGLMSSNPKWPSSSSSDRSWGTSTRKNDRFCCCRCFGGVK